MNRKKYRTSNMGLVSYLRYLGLEADEVFVDSQGVCTWMFPQEGVRETADKFFTTEVLVNLKDYNAQFGITKKEYFRVTSKS